MLQEELSSYLLLFLFFTIALQYFIPASVFKFTGAFSVLFTIFAIF